MMLIFAKAAYDAGKYFGLTYDEIIAYGAIGFLFFGAFAPLAAHLSDKNFKILFDDCLPLWNWAFLESNNSVGVKDSNITAMTVLRHSGIVFAFNSEILEEI